MIKIFTLLTFLILSTNVFTQDYKLYRRIIGVTEKVKEDSLNFKELSSNYNISSIYINENIIKISNLSNSSIQIECYDIISYESELVGVLPTNSEISTKISIFIVSDENGVKCNLTSVLIDKIVYLLIIDYKSYMVGYRLIKQRLD
jgi:hypothetical protein